MPAYRFCRPDDIPLLVEALNALYVPQVKGALPETLTTFKRDIRELDLWASSCMLVFEGTRPVGVMIGAKRAQATLIQKIAVAPEYHRKGHARHLLTSLSQKLAILGPKRIVAEIPTDLQSTLALFKRVGFSESYGYTDFVLNDEPQPSSANDQLVFSITLPELERQQLVPAAESSAWCRSIETISQLSANPNSLLQGRAIASVDRIEAYVLYCVDDATSGNVRILRLWCSNTSSSPALHFLVPLIRHLALRESRRLLIPCLSDEELAHQAAISLGFRPIREYRRVTLQAGTEP